jgi:hypothetical protein
MTHGHYKEILDQIFAVLSLSEDEKQKVTFFFKKKLASGLWKKFQGEFSEEVQNWVASHPDATPDEPEVKALQEKMLSKHSEEEVFAASRGLFKNILEEYLVSMSDGLDEPAKLRVAEIIKRI